MAASRVEWFLLVVEVILVGCVLLGMFPTTQSILYPWYESYNNPNVSNGSHDVRSFGMWTGRRNYAGDTNKPFNSFDHRINAVRAFQLISIGVVFTCLLLVINELFLKPWEDKFELEKPYIAHTYYWVQFICLAIQFDVILITAWLYTTLIQLDWCGWPVILLVCAVALSAIAFGFVTFQVIYPPRQDPGNNRVTGLALVLLISALGVCLVSLLTSFGCMVSSHPEDKREGSTNPKHVKTSMSVLIDSYENLSYKYAIYVFFVSEILLNLALILVISLMLFLRFEIYIKRLTFVSIGMTFAFYICSLQTTWLLSRAPALLDPKVRHSSKAAVFYVEVVKLLLNNGVLWLVVMAYIVDPSSTVAERSKLYKNQAKTLEEEEEARSRANTYVEMN